MPYKGTEEQRKYHAEYRARNREKLREQDRERRAAQRAHVNETAARCHRRKMRAARREVLALLGDCCQVCGIRDERVLQIDHVQNDGAEHRRAARGTHGYTAAWYRELRRVCLEEPGRLTLLCANCHCIKHWIADDD